MAGFEEITVSAGTPPPDQKVLSWPPNDSPAAEITWTAGQTLLQALQAGVPTEALNKTNAYNATIVLRISAHENV